MAPENLNAGMQYYARDKIIHVRIQTKRLQGIMQGWYPI